MKHIIMTLVILTSLSEIAFAQEKWFVELRPNLTFPTEKIADTTLRTGFGLEIAVNYDFMPHLSTYAGWGYNTYHSKTYGNLEDTDFDETGYTFGLQFIPPIGASDKLSQLLRAGGIFNYVEIENENGNSTDDCGHGLGGELGLGVQYELSNSQLLGPQIGYKALSGDFDLEGVDLDCDLYYFSIDLGITKVF